MSGAATCASTTWRPIADASASSSRTTCTTTERWPRTSATRSTTGATIPTASRPRPEKAGLHEFIETLDEGYQTRVGSWFRRGTELSGGQWQRIALARAFFRQSDILVLDEPTSVLDARAEYGIFRRFLELTAGRTTVLVSHRFSTVRMADTIYVFQQGRIIERGSHGELMARDGLYAELFNMQAEGFLLDGHSPPPVSPGAPGPGS